MLIAHNGGFEVLKKRKKIDKKRVYEYAKTYVNPDNIRIVILMIPLIILLINKIRNGEQAFEDLLDTSILVSFIFVFICNSIAAGIMSLVKKYTEDSVKLTEDYDMLIKKYVVDKGKMISIDQGIKKVYTPAVILAQKRICEKPFDIQIKSNEDANGNIKKYQLPEQVADHSEALFEAHNKSTIYNNINIRLDDFEYDKDTNKIVLTYSTTTYFDSLITNRAMDYKFLGSRSIREIYEPGPMISSLHNSKMSNHLGFNGFVELSDGNIIFVLRSQNVSIGKHTWSQSIGASLKSKYCVQDDYKVTEKGISNAIRQEINDELKIEVDKDENMCEYIFAFYRDLVEGGKPQFLFYYKTDKYNKDQFETHFRSIMREKENIQENKKKQIIDGDKFAYLTLSDLKKSVIEVDQMIIKKEKREQRYLMMPSTIASIILLLQNISDSNSPRY